MSNQNYTLEIVSHHPEFKSKSLRKYYVDGIETIGAWGNEPFEIRFKNNTWQKIQVKISLDGTDILTSKPATTEVSKDMWVVNGYGTLNLKAWPETSNGGAQFVFTSAEKSVAVHTHGDLSSRGIIAAAVFVEGHVEPVRLNPYADSHYPYRRRMTGDYTLGGGNWNASHDVTKGTAKSSSIGGATFSSNTSDTRGGAIMDSLNLSDAVPASASFDLERSKDLESLVSVGAGQHVDQKITYVTGLIKPTLTETVRVKYLWWDDLVAKLRTENVAAPQPSGFPGDKEKNIMSIGGTPRIGSEKQTFTRAEPMPAYSRF